MHNLFDISFAKDETIDYHFEENDSKIILSFIEIGSKKLEASYHSYEESEFEYCTKSFDIDLQGFELAGVNASIKYDRINEEFVYSDLETRVIDDVIASLNKKYPNDDFCVSINRYSDSETKGNFRLINELSSSLKSMTRLLNEMLDIFGDIESLEMSEAFVHLERSINSNLRSLHELVIEAEENQFEKITI